MGCEKDVKSGIEVLAAGKVSLLPLPLCTLTCMYYTPTQERIIMLTTFFCTEHARYRQAQRNLSDGDLLFVFEHGQQRRCAGVLHFFLGRRNIPEDKGIYRQFGHLEGTTVVVDDSGDVTIVITAYRNRRASRRIRSKAKYDRTSCRSTYRERH